MSIDGPTVLTVSDLAEIVTDLVRTHARTARWRKDATASPHVLSRDVTDLLVAFDLLRPAGPGRWTTTPIVSRYAAQDPTEPDEEPS